mmetsp:Transcript_64489/g.194571  ORF Transcript_64489/g.194571 Transcript_64489/m.194571 type:complete len:95 (-) Transcript_64489:115-399(-)
MSLHGPRGSTVAIACFGVGLHTNPILSHESPKSCSIIGASSCTILLGLVNVFAWSKKCYFSLWRLLELGFPVCATPVLYSRMNPLELQYTCPLC